MAPQSSPQELPSARDLPEPAGGTSHEAVVRGLRQVALVVWFLVFFAAVVPYVRLAWPQGVHFGLVLLGLHQLLTLGCLVRDERRRPMVALAGALFLLAVGVLAVQAPDVAPIHVWAPGHWSLAWVMWALGTLRRRDYLVVAGLGPLVLAGFDIAVRAYSGPITRLSLGPPLWFVPPVWLIALLADGLLLLADRADALATERRRLEQDHAAEQERAQARDESARLMHDHVLHALHAVAAPAELVSPELVVEECNDALQALKGVDHGEASVRIEHLIASGSALRAAGAGLTGTTPPLPRQVGVAMAAAAHEALSNIPRHAKATWAGVEVSQGDSGWCVEVVDDGRGFDPAGIDPSCLGLRRSVVERMDQIGGQATITSAPGQGTRVRLEWPRPRPVFVTEELIGNQQRTVRRYLLRTAWPEWGMGVVMTVLMAPLLAHGAALAAVAAAVLAIGLYALVHLRHHPMSRSLMILLCVAAVGGWAANLVWAPDRVTIVYYLWMAWVGAALMHIVVLQTSWRTGASMVLGWFLALAGGLWWRFGGDADWIALSPVVSTAGAEVMISFHTLQSAHRITRRHLVRAELAEQARREATKGQIDHYLDEFWSRRATAGALPLLQAVAVGRFRPGDPALAERARTLSAALRDELVLGPTQMRLVDVLAQLRTNGWVIASSLRTDAPEEVGERGTPRFDRLADLLLELGPARSGGQQVTLSATPDHATAVIFDPTPPQLDRGQELGDRHGCQVVATDELLRLRLPLGPSERAGDQDVQSAKP